MPEGVKSENGSMSMLKDKDLHPFNIIRYKQSPLGFHRHEFDELVVTLKGKGIHCTANEDYEIHAGDVFFIKPGMSHGYRDTDGLEIVNILYYPDKLGIPLRWLRESAGYRAFFDLEPESRRKLAFKGRLSLALEDLDAVERLVCEMETSLASHNGPGLFSAIASLMKLLTMLSKLYEKGASPSAAHLVRIGRAVAFMEGSYKRKISLEELAKVSRMSKSSLIREFRRLTGTTPVDYLLRLRLRKASALLTSGDVSIGEAALRNGFTDGNYFARQFKRFTGLSPRAYKKLAGNEQDSTGRLSFSTQL